MKIIEGKLHVQSGKKVAIIAARFNHLITDRLVEGAKDAYVRHGGNEADLDLVLVPGAYELPMALERILATGRYDAACCLGAVIRGSTPHFDFVSAGLGRFPGCWSGDPRDHCDHACHVAADERDVPALRRFHRPEERDRPARAGGRRPRVRANAPRARSAPCA